MRQSDSDTLLGEKTLEKKQKKEEWEEAKE